MAEHSKTPWQLCHHLESMEKDASCKCGYRGGIWGDAGELLVCEMRNCDLHEGHEMTPVGDRATQIANAQFIVRAVNSHDALAKALEPFTRINLAFTDGIDDSATVMEYEGGCITLGDCRAARAALALCEQHEKTGRDQ